MVGDLVWVAKACGDGNHQPYFQGCIIQIILDGSLLSTTVVKQRQEIHELIISRVMYIIKPVGYHNGLSRVLIEVDLVARQTILFETERELLDHQHQPATFFP